eukprot:maker-scaffold40_size501252-snap-gene-2.15 protein:Tk06164 transcript:maker-scaffold40_size501252-snap-gene-2.15-mRNA-1 annotation:"phosphatidate phosphatase ppapdc1a-like"
MVVRSASSLVPDHWRYTPPTSKVSLGKVSSTQTERPPASMMSDMSLALDFNASSVFTRASTRTFEPGEVVGRSVLYPAMAKTEAEASSSSASVMMATSTVQVNRRPMGSDAFTHLVLRRLLQEGLTRVILLCLFVYTDFQEPFQRVIQKEDLNLYSNPTTGSYFPVIYLWLTAIFLPALTILAVQIFHRADILDFMSAVLSCSLLLPLNGLVTNVIKLSVGRPRPDFLHRCWPDGNFRLDGFENPLHQQLDCSGNLAQISDGRKSFPSGHASFAFATFGFVFFYLSGKCRTFVSDPSHFFQSFRFLSSILCLLCPLAIAISRTCDYHHHWQDVTVGSILGLTLAWACHRVYYPPISSPNCDTPLICLHPGPTQFDSLGSNGRGNPRFMSQPNAYSSTDLGQA